MAVVDINFPWNMVFQTECESSVATSLYHPSPYNLLSNASNAVSLNGRLDL